MRENGLERTTKTIPVGIFADIRFFHPFSGVEIFGFDFFDENGLQGTTKTIPEVIFAVITFFSPFRRLKIRGFKFFTHFFTPSLLIRENGKEDSK